MMRPASSIDTPRTFVDARQRNRILTEYPGQKPQTLDSAYVIQDAAIALQRSVVGGWKIGRVADRDIARFGAARLVGPIFVDMISFASGGDPVEMPVLSGFAAVEAELMLRITGAGARTSDEARGAVDEMRFGIEIASSPFEGINDHGPAVTASDFGNNFGLVLGPVVEDWRTRDLSAVPVDMAIDGVAVGKAFASDGLDGPFDAVAFLLANLERRGIALTPGTWVSTGAITGVHSIAPGQIAIAKFAGNETVGVRICAAPTS